MKEIELYTFEDAERDLEEGASESEVALKKWESILNALRAIEEVAIQITSFCVKHQKFECKGCPVTNYDYPCGHPYATFTLFYQELRKTIALAERIYAILTAVDREDKERRKDFV